MIVGYYLYSLSPRIQERIAPIAVGADEAQSFDKKFDSLQEQIKEAVGKGQKEEVSLVITEKEVNSKLVQMLAEGELPLKKILINFGDGYFLTYVEFASPIGDAKTAAMGRFEIVDGKPKVVLSEFDLGRVPLPKSTKGRVEQVLDILVSLELADFQVDITDVQIKNHQLTITGTTKVAK